MMVSFNDELWDRLVKIIRLHAHARSCRKIGNLKEAESFEEKADRFAAAWARKLRVKV